VTGNRTLRREVAAAARFLHDRGWVANHDGNVTARDGAVLIATPTATSKRLVDDAGLVEVDAAGKPTGGRGKVFGEIGLHLVVYERRPDVGAIVHAHPPHATAIACSAHNPIERPFLAEALVSLGPAIPKLAAAAPGDPTRAALAPWCELGDAALLGNHGAIAWGRDCEQALLRLELVEHLAKIAILAAPLGGVKPLPVAMIAPMMQARARASIGRVADRAVEIAARLGGGGDPRPVVACAPAPHAAVPTIPPGGAPGADLAAIVREEIVRALRAGG
jgi:L-fuculose-phosphate aldolase